MKMNDIHNRYVLPTIEERTAYGYKRLDPYTKLFEERIIFLGQGIDDTVANDVMAQLLTLESMDPDRDIMMYINSPGGSFTALTAIYDTMQFVRPDVMTICLGQAASAAAVLLAGGTAGKRYALEHSRILNSLITYCQLPNFQTGQANQHQHHADNPEAHYHLCFFPALLLVMVV